MTTTVGPAIELEGVRTHNLQNIDVSIPLGKLSAVSGVSGSGKSSLAFDTLYAEGQRRYIESFSAYARQFLDRLDRPDADRIDNIPPAIAVRQGARHAGNRSTIATATEVYDYLRLLFANAGEIVCPGCGRTVTSQTPAAALAAISLFSAGTRYQICFPAQPAAQDGGNAAADFLRWLRESGFERLISGNATVTLGEKADAPGKLAETVWVVVDRLSAGKTQTARILDSLETAFSFGQDACLVLEEVAGARNAGNGAQEIATIDNRQWRLHRYSSRLNCPACEIDFLALEPRLFSFNAPLGACPACQGLGIVRRAARDRMNEPCARCGGARLQPAALAVRINGDNIADVCRRTITEARAIADNWRATFDDAQLAAIRTPWAEIKTRLDSLEGIGLGYLALDRPLRTLSAGEAQRVSLTAALGASLVNALYVLDEPSAGLHPADNGRVIEAILRLRDAGNTVVVVEHDAEFLRVADELIDVGPGAGRKGGRIVYQGPPEGAASVAESQTGAYLSGSAKIAAGLRRACRAKSASLVLHNARSNNLKHVTVEFPLGTLCVVSGVSGAGKSTLVTQTLYPAVCAALGQPCAVESPGLCDGVTATESLHQALLVDPSPIGRTSRSNPATYLKAFSEVRRIFSQTREARLHNYTPGTFSFNSAAGGRCAHCQGTGVIAIDMHFLADVTMTCPECHGSRYRPEILEARYQGCSIADVLAMTAAEAFTFFRNHHRLKRRLKPLFDVGLDYLPLGQPATSLSGGESQRMKLALALAEGAVARSARGTLLILDEPTTGLHPADVDRLLDCFDALLAVGHSLVIIEHHLDVIAAADWVIDLGPGAGDNGGTAVAQGIPEEIAACAASVTGRFLRKQL